MLARLKAAGLIWPTLLALLGLSVLVSLGTWQLQRKSWKEALIGKIAARVAADPLPVARADALHQAGEDVDYLRVTARGRFHHDKERYFYRPGPDGLGWHVYTPLELGSGSFVWVNRGYVPDRLKAPEARPQGQVAGEVVVTGLVRVGTRRGVFTPDNDMANNLWYWPDIAALTTSAFGRSQPPALPFILEAEARPEPSGGYPKGGVTPLSLPNRHLEYALTWYGLALTLIAVYFAFARSRLRLSR
jgi:surfeit locus 1 family protein